MGFSLQWLLLLKSMGFRVWTQYLWCMGLLFHCTWNLPRARIKPMSPALAGRFSTTGPPGKSYAILLKVVPCPLLFCFRTTRAPVWLNPIRGEILALATQSLIMMSSLALCSEVGFLRWERKGWSHRERSTPCPHAASSLLQPL